MSPKHNPRIVLALGGGGARGLAHIGVLQVFQEAGIPIAGIVGTSMGALIGSTYAAETDLYYLARVMDALGWEDLVDFNLSNLGLVDGSKVQALINLLTKGKTFETLKLPFWAVATDLHTGEEIVFREGPLAPAIRASISVPGIFNPVEYNHRILVDGAVVAGVPVNIAKEMKGELTIAVNVGFDHTQHKIKNIFDVLSKVQDIMGNRLDSYQMQLADLAIVPQLGNIRTMHFHRAKECVQIGREAAEKAVSQIKEKMKHIQKKSSEEDLVSNG